MDVAGTAPSTPKEDLMTDTPSQHRQDDAPRFEIQDSDEPTILKPQASIQTGVIDVQGGPTAGRSDAGFSSPDDGPTPVDPSQAEMLEGTYLPGASGDLGTGADPLNSNQIATTD
jgi:hypothetical protein